MRHSVVVSFGEWEDEDAANLAYNALMGAERVLLLDGRGGDLEFVYFADDDVETQIVLDVVPRSIVRTEDVA